MPSLLRIGAAALAALFLLAPAAWNGFPLLQYDTGGYLARWYQGTLEISRSVVYGLFLAGLHGFDFWPALIVQALLTIWILALTLRVCGLGGPLALLAFTAILSVFTTLPWLTSILLTDIFVGLAVLAAHLLIFHGGDLGRFERWALVAFITFAAATHSATLAVLIALSAAALVVAAYDRKMVPFAGTRRVIAALAFSVALVFGANALVAGRLAWTPGGVSLMFGRMLQDGIVHRYLADHCPDRRLILCAHQAELPRDADDFFWGEGIFDKLGRFKGLDQEMKTIAIESLADYPWLQLKTAAAATWQQLTMVGTGYGIVHWIWHTYDTIKTYTPAAVPAMQAARQQSEKFDAPRFNSFNRLHIPVALASTALLAVIAVLALGGWIGADLGLLAISALLTILANAFVCGALSGPHNRYGARLVWIAPLVVLLAAWRWAEQRRTAGRQDLSGNALGTMAGATGTSPR
jgi:hypothetical protein